MKLSVSGWYHFFTGCIGLKKSQILLYFFTIFPHICDLFTWVNSLELKKIHATDGKAAMKFMVIKSIKNWLFLTVWCPPVANCITKILFTRDATQKTTLKLKDKEKCPIELLKQHLNDIFFTAAIHSDDFSSTAMLRLGSCDINTGAFFYKALVKAFECKKMFNHIHKYRIRVSLDNPTEKAENSKCLLLQEKSRSSWTRTFISLSIESLSLMAQWQKLNAINWIVADRTQLNGYWTYNTWLDKFRSNNWIQDRILENFASLFQIWRKKKLLLVSEVLSSRKNSIKSSGHEMLYRCCAVVTPWQSNATL